MNLPLPKELILIVDDVPANIHVLAAALRDDYRIKTATSGATALAIASRDDTPDLILLDVMMPSMSGHDVLERLRGQPATQNIPVIFVTADTSEGSELAGLERGATDFLTKPVNVPVLRARVRNLLAQRRLQRELKLNELKLHAMLDSSMQFIGLLDTEGRVLHANRQVHELLGTSLDVLRGRHFAETPFWAGSEKQRESVRAATVRAKEGFPSRFETVHQSADGKSMILDFSIRPVHGPEGEVVFLLPEASDITQHRAAEESIRHLANNDPLTGLPNRTLLADRVTQAIRSAERSKEPFALIFLDLESNKNLGKSNSHFMS